jgi:hypothetical protein
MRGGKKTGVIRTAFGEIGVAVKVPQGVGGSAVYGTAGNKLKVRRVFAESKAVVFPAE